VVPAIGATILYYGICLSFPAFHALCVLLDFIGLTISDEVLPYVVVYLIIHTLSVTSVYLNKLSMCKVADN
jgi:hypothetical protein